MSATIHKSRIIALAVVFLIVAMMVGARMQVTTAHEQVAAQNAWLRGEIERRKAEISDLSGLHDMLAEVLARKRVIEVLVAETVPVAEGLADVSRLPRGAVVKRIDTTGQRLIVAGEISPAAPAVDIAQSLAAAKVLRGLRVRSDSVTFAFEAELAWPGQR